MQSNQTNAKRIIVVTHAGGSPYHGPNMRWYYLGKALQKLGVEVEIVSSSSFHKYLTPPKVHNRHETETIDGLRYHWIKTEPYSSRGLRQVFNQIEFVLGCYKSKPNLSQRKADVVIASSPHPFVSFPAVSLAKESNARFVFEVRDLWPEILIELGGFRKWHPYILALFAAEKFSVRNADKIISVKPGDGEYFNNKYNYPLSRFSYTPNGFLPGGETTEAPQVVRALRDQYRFIVGYVGALSTYYGLDHLIELAKLFKDQNDIGFVIVGKGEKQEELIEKARHHALNNMHFVGAISKSSVPRTLDMFDTCYVGVQELDVHKYGISCNKIYEYMHAGKPIIGSYTTDHDPVKESGGGCVARPGDYQPLVEFIYKLIKHPDLKYEMGRAARSYFDNNHDFSAVAQKLSQELFPEFDDERTGLMK